MNKNLTLIKQLEKLIKDAENHKLYLKNLKNYQGILKTQEYIKDIEKIITDVKNN